MSRVDFYHLQNQRLEEALPRLLEKAYETGKKAILKIGNEERVDFLNSLLWSYNEESFLPHGSSKDGSAELQPIWLTAKDDNPNGAVFLFLVDGAEVEVERMQEFERVFYVFDGGVENQIISARELWKKVKLSAMEAIYWQQENNTWKQKG